MHVIIMYTNPGTIANNTVLTTYVATIAGAHTSSCVQFVDDGTTTVTFVQSVDNAHAAAINSKTKVWIISPRSNKTNTQLLPEGWYSPTCKLIQCQQNNNYVLYCTYIIILTAIIIRSLSV